jgi:hypothetical protein
MRAALRTVRYWGPLVGCFACLIVSPMVHPIAAWLLIILAFGLLLDSATALWEKAGGTGSLHDHRQ